MPLDNIQKRVAAVLLPLRSKDSVFAGGSVLQKDGFRLSDDQDIFHPAGVDIVAVARRDLAVLQAAGFAVEPSRPYPGLVEAKIGLEDEGFTLVQWVESGAWNFFKPVPDDEFGWRLHMADLSVNKVLAAGGRRQVRDYVDLMLIHKNIIPLWHAIWAAPGKDEGWSPLSLAEQIAATNNFKQLEIDVNIKSLIPLNAGEISLTLRLAIQECRDIFAFLPAESAGSLFVDKDGGLLNDWKFIVAHPEQVHTIQVEEGGAWPSGPDIDHELIQRIIDAYQDAPDNKKRFDFGSDLI